MAVVLAGPATPIAGKLSSAREVLDSLAAAGRLLPPGGEREVQYRHRDGDDTDLCGSAEFDPTVAEMHDGWRTVTTWPDGTTLHGPWRELSTEEETNGDSTEHN